MQKRRRDDVLGVRFDAGIKHLYSPNNGSGNTPAAE